jgi:hypothetical protein
VGKEGGVLLQECILLFAITHADRQRSHATILPAGLYKLQRLAQRDRRVRAYT